MVGTMRRSAGSLSSKEKATHLIREAYSSWLEHKIYLARGKRLIDLLSWKSTPKQSLTAGELAELQDLINARYRELCELLNRTCYPAAINEYSIQGLERELAATWAANPASTPRNFKVSAFLAAAGHRVNAQGVVR